MDGDSTTENAFVYFIFNIDSKAIKIGMAKNVEKRLKSLQTSNPIILELLHTIHLDSVEDAQKLEYVLHQKFSHLRMNGEWFEASEELRTYIKHAPVSYSQSLDLSEPKPYRSIPLSQL
nr:GIY-YIG nuclease family protein [Waterburya agarophytonicola]